MSNKIKTTDVQYIESGTYVGGEEAYYMTFRSNGEEDPFPHPKKFWVITDESKKKLEKRGIKFDVWRE